jgi:hypothetical protein
MASEQTDDLGYKFMEFSVIPTPAHTTEPKASEDWLRRHRRRTSERYRLVWMVQMMIRFADNLLHWVDHHTATDCRSRAIRQIQERQVSEAATVLGYRIVRKRVHREDTVINYGYFSE